MNNYNRVVDKQYDLVVVGGGIAGLCAAIAAARIGSRTAIIQDRSVFGGNSSSEIGIGPCGSVYYNAWTMETGIIEELMLEDRARNHEALSDAGKTNSIYDLILYEAACAEQNLDIYLNTSVLDVDMETVSNSSGQEIKLIKSIKACQQRSEKRFHFFAEQFIDCTGDGTLAYLAGASFRYGRESRSEFNEFLAPAKADNVIMGSSIAIMARNIGRPVKFRKPEWAVDYRTLEEIGPHRGLGNFDNPTFSGFWWMEIGNPFDQVEDYDQIREQLLAHILGVWNYIKNYSSNKEAAENFALEWVGMLPGKRESRRIVGDVTVCENNAHHDEGWPDRVCCSGWFLDIHITGGILNKQEPAELSHQDANYYNHTLVAPFTLPLRSMYSKDVANLWMAGRNISITRAVLASVRMQLILGNVGQAVGTAAAYSVKHGLTPRQAANPQGRYIADIQQQLLKDDVNILGVKNEDPYDLSRKAKVIASSEQALNLGEPNLSKFKSLEQPLAQVFPVTSDTVEELEFYVRNTADIEKVIDVELHKLERIWDQGAGILISKSKITVPPEYCGWINWKVASRVEPHKPYRVALYAGEAISWAKSVKQTAGTLSQYLYESSGGCNEKNRQLPSLQPEELILPPFRKWNQEARVKYSMCLKIKPEQRPYGPDNINNGYAWPSSMPNLWMSDSREGTQHFELCFEDKILCSSLHISFDTDLNAIHTRLPGFWRAPACARDWNLLAWNGETWELIYSEKDNYHRKRIVSFKAIETCRLKVEILATNGADYAGVYEVRIY